MNNHIRTSIVAGLTAAAVFAAPAAATADEVPRDDCKVVDYQGAPAPLCPDRVPDPTNCYTGDYQGAPIEICLATGETLPEGSTIDGEPVVYHTSVEYVAEPAPVEVAPVVEVAAPVPPTPAPSTAIPEWLEEFQAALVANGGW